MSKSLSEGLGVPSSPGTYSAAIEGQTGVNTVLMRRDPSLPPLYASGVKWEVRRGDPSETKWRTPQEIVTSGWGDCQELSAYRAAELRVTGVDPAAHVRVYPTERNTYHAVVARGNGLVEDPSVVLGMPPFPREPMTNKQLPRVEGAGDVINPLESFNVIRQSLRAMHPAPPNAGVEGWGVFGKETGRKRKVNRVKDVAPEHPYPTFHVRGHRIGSVCGWKGVYRIPMRDGSAVVGMTETHVDPADCIGDAASLISSLASDIVKVPGALLAMSPLGAVATTALMDPTVQHALGKVGSDVKTAVKNTKKNGGSKSKPAGGSDGWPSDWDVNGWDVNSSDESTIVGWGLSSLAHIVTDPINAVKNLVQHPSLGNVARLGLSPLTGIVNTLPGGTSVTSRLGLTSGGAAPAQAPMAIPQTLQSGIPGTMPGMDPSMMAQYQQYNQPQYVPPGYNPTTYAQPSYQYPSQAAINAPTAADLGLPLPDSAGGAMPSLPPAFTMPTDMSALASYQDPGASALGYWNAPDGGYMPAV